MQIAVLPKSLQPYAAERLVRVSEAPDGGYVVDVKSIDASKFLLSCGVNEDWSFEEEFTTRNRIPVLTLDGSVGEQHFKHQMRNSYKEPWKFLWYWRLYRSYKRFYSAEREHQQLYVGKSMPNGRSLLEIANGAVSKDKRPFFIKMDIEGSEYETLSDVLTLAGDLSGLIIEFHAVDKNIQLIVDFVKKLPLRICHVHVNNNGGVNKDNVPTVIECSFSKFCGTQKSDTGLPLPLDRTNWHKLPDFELQFH